MPNPIEAVPTPSTMPRVSLKLANPWSASSPLPPSPPTTKSSRLSIKPLTTPPPAHTHKPITLYKTAASVDDDELRSLSLPESKFLLDTQPNAGAAHKVAALALSVASPTLSAARPTTTPDAITSPPSSTPTSPLSTPASPTSVPSVLPARPSSPPAPLSSLSLSTLSSLSLSHRQRWRPHPQLFRIDEDTHETEDEHWHRLCQQYSMTACFHYVHTPLSNAAAQCSQRAPPPTLASLLSPTFVSCMGAGYRCVVVRALPWLSSSCQLSVDWTCVERPMLKFGAQSLPLSAIYAVTTPTTTSSSTSASSSSPTAPQLSLTLHLPLRLLQLTFQTPTEHAFFHTQLRLLLTHTATTLSPTSQLSYDPTAFLQSAQRGVAARRHVKGSGGTMVVEVGSMCVELGNGEVRWIADGCGGGRAGEEEGVEGKGRSWVRRLLGGGRRDEKRQCVMSLLDDVKAVMAGKQTKAWMRSDQLLTAEGHPPINEQHCFSLVSDDCTMDIEMADGRNVWVRGLLDLIDVLREARAEEERVKTHRRAKSAAKLPATKQPKVLDATTASTSSLPQRNSLTLPLPAPTTTPAKEHHGSFHAKRQEMAAKRAAQQEAAAAAQQQAQQEAEGRRASGSSVGGGSRRRSGSSSVGGLGGWLGGVGSGDGSECEESDVVGVDDWSDFDMSTVVTRARSTSEAAPLPKAMIPARR